MSNQRIKTGMRVIDRASKCKGTIGIVYRGEFTVQWDNGLSGSWKNWETFANSGGVLLTDETDTEPDVDAGKKYRNEIGNDGLRHF